MKKLIITLVLCVCMIMLTAYTQLGNFNVVDTLQIDSLNWVYNRGDTVQVIANTRFNGNATFSGDFTAEGYVTGKKSGTYAYLVTNDTTEIVTADSLHFIQGVFANSPVEDFEISEGNLVFTGTDTAYYEILYFANLSSSIANTTPEIAVVNDDSIYTPQSMGNFLKNADQTYLIAGNLVLELAYADTIRLEIEADKTCELDFKHFTTSIKEFFD